MQQKLGESKVQTVIRLNLHVPSNMFQMKSNLNRRSNRYNIYQPQRYAIYVVGKWMGLIGSALLLFGLTIKWYFLLDDNSTSVFNLLTLCLIAGSILMFGLGASFIVGLHWYVEKKYTNNTQDNSEEIEKAQKHLREEHRNQSKRYKDRSSWLIWKPKKNFRIRVNKSDQQSSVANSIQPNSTTIYNANATESSFQIGSNDSYMSDTTSTSFSSTKKLVRTNSKFNQPSLPIIDETKQQNPNDDYTSPPQPNQSVSTSVAYVTDQQTDVIFDPKNMSESNKPNKTKHVHKLSTSSGKNYILEAFLKQDLTEPTKSVKSSDEINSTNQAGSSLVSKSSGNQIMNQSSNQSSISSQNVNGALNDALDLTE